MSEKTKEEILFPALWALVIGLTLSQATKPATYVLIVFVSLYVVRMMTYSIVHNALKEKRY